MCGAGASEFLGDLPGQVDAEFFPEGKGYQLLPDPEGERDPDIIIGSRIEEAKAGHRSGLLLLEIGGRILHFLWA